jgi:hypothetical protein
MKKVLLFFLLGAVLLTLSGCLGTFNYQVPVDTPIAKYKYNCTVAVEKFKDERPTVGGTGKMWLSLIPLMPFGWGYYNRPEDGKSYLSLSSFKFDPVEQLANASEMSLQYSGLFRNIYLIDNYTDTKPDFIFTGIIKSTLYRQKVFTYCLSFCGPIFWLLGAPEGWTANQLEIDFILKSVRDDRIVWTYTAKSSKDQAQWFYCWGQDVKNYVPVMQKCMNEAIINLQEFMKGTPNSFSDSDLKTGIRFYKNKDYEQAFTYIKKAAEEDSSLAQYYLGVMYYIGTYTEKDEKKAFMWFMKSAEQGNANAQFAVGNMYDNGKGVAKDPVKGKYWIEKAKKTEAFMKN